MFCIMERCWITMVAELELGRFDSVKYLLASVLHCRHKRWYHWSVCIYEVCSISLSFVTFRWLWSCRPSQSYWRRRAPEGMTTCIKRVLPSMFRTSTFQYLSSYGKIHEVKIVHSMNEVLTRLSWHWCVWFPARNRLRICTVWLWEGKLWARFYHQT